MSQPIALRPMVPAVGAGGCSCRGGSFAHWPTLHRSHILYLLLMQMYCRDCPGRCTCCSIRSLSVGFLAAAWHHERGEVAGVNICSPAQVRPACPAAAGGVHLIGLLVAR